MNRGYKRLICGLCAASAAFSMAVVPAGAEVCGAEERGDCVLCEDVHAGTMSLAVLAEDAGDEQNKDGAKTTLKEQTRSSWQIYALIGGGVLAVIAVISLLAEQMKKK